jgi:hypothetical protein
MKARTKWYAGNVDEIIHAHLYAAERIRAFIRRNRDNKKQSKALRDLAIHRDAVVSLGRIFTGE